MTSRREFLRISTLAASAGCVFRAPSTALAAAPGGLIYGVQLYMVRRQAQTDLAALLKAIHQIGFTQIELYPIAYSHPVAELRRIVADAGLGSVSGHFNYDTDFEDRIEYARQLGMKFMVCPMLPGRQWNSLAGFREAADQFNKWGAKVRAAGMTFLFHNHCYEFKPIDGTTGFEELMKHTDPALVKLEMDAYWVTQGGHDPLQFLSKYKDRVELVHMKDRLPNVSTSYVLDKTSEHFVELGKGTINWPEILRQAKRQGIRYAFVDQDETAAPPLESLKTSFTYLQSLHM